MAASKLTDSAITKAAKDAAASGRRVELIDQDEAGLRLRITPAGARTWTLNCRDALGRMRRYTLGAYPALGLAKAREAARDTRHDVRKGADPVADARRMRAVGRAARNGDGTLEWLLGVYEKQKGGDTRSWPARKRQISLVFDSRLKTPLAVLRLVDLQLTADNWHSSQSAALAVRCLRPILRWGAQAGRAYCSRELAALVPPATVRQRDRTLSRDELARLLPVLRASASPYAAALQFIAYTLARREEVAAACWRDVDLAAGMWTLPVTKNGKPHTVPLSSQALELLRARQPRDQDGNVTDAPDALVFVNSRGGRLERWDKETKKIMALSNTTDWTRHDLRRTGATMLGEMGIMPSVIEAALGHTAIHSQLAAIYNKSRYLPEVAASLQKLADMLELIEQGGAEIIPISLRRA